MNSIQLTYLESLQTEAIRVRAARSDEAANAEALGVRPSDVSGIPAASSGALIPVVCRSCRRGHQHSTANEHAHCPFCGNIWNWRQLHVVTGGRR